MSGQLGRIIVELKTGREELHASGAGLGHDLLSFWSWSASDLVSNATRGILAEFIVARALALPVGGVRVEWDAWDLETDDGTKVEVKSAAYLQSWHQDRLSTVTFGIAETQAFDAETNCYSSQAARHADVYVFALLAHQDKATVDPLDVDQWRFYVVPTCVLNARVKSQSSITLSGLEKINRGSVGYAELRDAVERASIRNRIEGAPATE